MNYCTVSIKRYMFNTNNFFKEISYRVTCKAYRRSSLRIKQCLRVYTNPATKAHIKPENQTVSKGIY